MNMSSNSSTNLGDQAPTQPIEGKVRWIAAIVFFVVTFVVYVLILTMSNYLIAGGNYLASPEDPENAESSSNTSFETSNLQQLDSVAPPKPYKQVMIEIQLQGAGGHLAWPDSFVTWYATQSQSP
ncbi:hypothetical protein EDB81DRAFT_885988 [Dactylonectria macrodidyma]|uniref:Uncharacterized protein n=1 Tax=Dactylonectria macrodidyma TaxID=307937 RepID=A0A9P9EIG2_9HYPO|nr:hypothetical protein EDB81DRAFT_885988 [Dactylonectria macrodidyma]